MVTFAWTWNPRSARWRRYYEAIWPDVQIELVENVNVLASKLRETLNEPNGTRYIFNKRGEGYYFNPKVMVECAVVPLPNEETVAAGPDGPTVQPPRRSIRRNLTLWALAVAMWSMSLCLRRVVRLLASGSPAVTEPRPNGRQRLSFQVTVITGAGRWGRIRVAGLP
jgi:hypothetical protein